MRNTARNETRIYEVAHPDLGKVWVAAESWELATVEAAKIWGLPWGKLVAEMVCVRNWRAMKHVCARCGRIFNGEGYVCAACEKALATEREQTALRMKKTWYLGAKEAPFGT